MKAILDQRSDDCREGIAASFRHFGGVPRTVLGDNAKALVVGRDRQTGVVTFHPSYLAFCRDWDVQPRACGPYRARTKGKTESGVKYVRRNGLAARAFESFAALESHLVEWMTVADNREHGTTHERPIDRFERDERASLRALPARLLVVRHRRLRRRVSNDVFVDVDTVRYSVPYRFVRTEVEVLVGDVVVEVFLGAERIALHRRSSEPHARVVEPAHFDGLWRRSPPPLVASASLLEALGRSPLPANVRETDSFRHPPRASPPERRFGGSLPAGAMLSDVSMSDRSGTAVDRAEKRPIKDRCLARPTNSECFVVLTDVAAGQ